jgi:hypothetical protein
MHKVLTIIFAHNATDPSNEFSWSSSQNYF